MAIFCHWARIYFDCIRAVWSTFKAEMRYFTGSSAGPQKILAKVKRNMSIREGAGVSSPWLASLLQVDGELHQRLRSMIRRAFCQSASNFTHKRPLKCSDYSTVVVSVVHRRTTKTFVRGWGWRHHPFFFGQHPWLLDSNSTDLQDWRLSFYYPLPTSHHIVLQPQISIPPLDSPPPMPTKPPNPPSSVTPSRRKL